MNKETVEQISKELKPALEKLAEQLGTTAEKVWEVTVAQAQVEVISSITAVALWYGAFFICFVVFVAVIHKYPNATVGELTGDVGTAVFVVGLVSLLLGTVVLMANYTSAITAYYNPEYWAYQDILEKVK